MIEGIISKKSSQKRYYEKHKEKRLKYRKRYYQSDKGKECLKRYRQSDKGKECLKRWKKKVKKVPLFDAVSDYLKRAKRMRFHSKDEFNQDILNYSKAVCQIEGNCKKVAEKIKESIEWVE